MNLPPHQRPTNRRLCSRPQGWLMGVFVAGVLLAGCDKPCQDACVRLVPCLGKQALTTQSCQRACSQLETRLTKLRAESVFDEFTQCVDALRPWNVGYCRVEFNKCAQNIPPAAWQSVRPNVFQ